MTKVEQFRKEVDMLNEAIDIEGKAKLDEGLELLRQWAISWEEATKGMTLQEKGELDLSIAKAVAKAYAEGRTE